MLEHVTLTNNDLECLKPDQWLYDNVIDFNLQYQRHFMFGYDKDDIEILSPSLVQMIKTFRRKDLMVSCTQFKAPANILKKLRIFARRLEEVNELRKLKVYPKNTYSS